MTTDPSGDVPTTPRSFHRLTAEAFADLQRQVQPPFVQAATTELQAGFMLGQQDVLKKVRDGFAVST